MRTSLRFASVLLAATTAVVGLGATSASAASSTQCHFTSAQPQVEFGSSGTAVMQAQCELNFAYEYRFGGGIAEDGKFGSITRSVTKGFQNCEGLTADGIIGPKTWAALNRWVAAGVQCNTTTSPTG